MELIVEEKCLALGTGDIYDISRDKGNKAELGCKSVYLGFSGECCLVILHCLPLEACKHTSEMNRQLCMPVHDKVSFKMTSSEIMHIPMVCCLEEVIESVFSEGIIAQSIFTLANLCNCPHFNLLYYENSAEGALGLSGIFSSLFNVLICTLKILIFNPCNNLIFVREPLPLPRVLMITAYKTSLCTLEFTGCEVNTRVWEPTCW